MQHHDLVHGGLRIWPLDQTSLRHPNLCCTIHHKHAPRAHSAKRVHKNCSHLNCSGYSLFCYIMFHLASGNNVETCPTCFQSQWSVPRSAPLCWRLCLTAKKRNMQISSRLVLWWWQPYSVAVQHQLVTTELWQHQTDGSLQLTPVATYTSGCVLSHLRLFCDV